MTFPTRKTSSWTSPVPQSRWFGFRKTRNGSAAFLSLSEFEEAQLDEIRHALNDHEAVTLGRLLARGRASEIELFIRTHGSNPLFDPQREIELSVGVPRADVVFLNTPASLEARRAVLEGRVLHVLFQAGDATRFQKGPLYSLSPFQVACDVLKSKDFSPQNPHDKQEEIDPTTRQELQVLVDQISAFKARLPKEIIPILFDWGLGPKQLLALRAAVRRIVSEEIQQGRVSHSEAEEKYKRALYQQQILFFVSRRNNVANTHDENLRKKHSFFGFHPEHLVTIEQELARGLTAQEDGTLSLIEGEETCDAAGHLYALIQASRTGDFTTYTESGRPIKPMELDALSYFFTKGARVMNIIRINDMDRHSTEIVNTKALSYALEMFSQGYVNLIETVGNPTGQKGGIGMTFGDPDLHVLTETHENSFPSLSRVFEAAMKTYLQENEGVHPPYNAMRQWADLEATRHVLRDFGGRIVFVPRQKKNGDTVSHYLGVDMPMGDLSLLGTAYKSRLFQFRNSEGKELLIHDMKNKGNLPIALRTLLRQLQDPHMMAAAHELATGTIVPFEKNAPLPPLYGAPAPEFE